MRVWIVRHGQSETNVRGEWTGHLDVSLTEKGREDALCAAKILSGVSFDKIYSSDLKRAKNTAEIAIPGCKYETSSLLREIDVGNIAGKPLSVVIGADGVRMNENGYDAFGGESNEEFSERVKAFMKILEDEKCENIAVFSHNGFIRRFLDLALGIKIPRKAMSCKNCTVAIFEYNDKAWRLHSWINPT